MISSRDQLGLPGLAVPRLEGPGPAGAAARGVPGMLVPRLGVNWWVPGRLLPVGPGSRPGSRDGLGRGGVVPTLLGCWGAPVINPVVYISSIRHVQIYTCIYIYIYISIHPHLVVPHIYWPVAVKIRVVATSDVPIYPYPATVRVNRHVLRFPRPWT